MSVPAGLLDAFAGVMLLVAAISAARLALSWGPASRRFDSDVDVSHLLMGIAMAGTLTARLATLPALAWEIIFAVLTAWFAHRVTREYRSGRGLRALVSEHHAPHLLHSAAMLYMFLALRPAPTHAGMAGMSAAGAQTLRLPTLALLFAFLLCAYVVADLDRLPAPHHSRPAPAPALALVGVSVPASAGVFAPAGPGASAPAGASITATPVTSPATATSSASPAPASSLVPGLGRLLSPGMARGCRIAMGVTMAFMLIIMI